jgi:predicted SpoU family rRNA methylase
VCKPLAKRWNTSEEKVITVVRSFGLFIVENDLFFSLRLLRSMEEKISKARKSAQIRWNNAITDANAMQPHSECNASAMQNHANKRKEKKGKENKINENKINIPAHLVDVWLAYVEMRKSIKKPMTDSAQIFGLSALEKISTDPDTQVKIVEQSVFNSWQGLFPLKEQTGLRQQKNEFKQDNNDIPMLEL